MRLTRHAPAWDCTSLADGPRRHAACGGECATTCAREYTCSVVALSRKRRAALPALDRGALTGFPLGVPAHHPPPRARAPACGALAPGALQRARRAGPHVPLPVTRAASTRFRAWPLAGNGLLPSPALSFPAALRSAGAPRTPPGRFRALHITRALCAEAARGSAQQLARAGAWRRSFLEVGGFEKRREEFSRAPSARAL